MVLWLKFIHLSAIAIWSAGLVCLPGLCVARTSTLSGEALYRLQAAVRYTCVVVVSPAAFVAIASGIALMFARQTFEPWFSIKLTLVAALVLMHGHRQHFGNSLSRRRNASDEHQAAVRMNPAACPYQEKRRFLHVLRPRRYHGPTDSPVALAVAGS